MKTIKRIEPVGVLNAAHASTALFRGGDMNKQELTSLRGRIIPVMKERVRIALSFAS